MSSNSLLFISSELEETSNSDEKEADRHRGGPAALTLVSSADSAAERDTNFGSHVSRHAADPPSLPLNRRHQPPVSHSAPRVALHGPVRWTRPRSEIEGNLFPVVLYQHNWLGFPGLGIATHARRICRHPGERQSNYVGTLVKELENGTSRHVPLDHVPIDQRRVTGTGAHRNAIFGFELNQLRIFSEIDIGSKILQVPDPPCTAPSAGRLMYIKSDARQVKSRGEG